MLFNPQRFTRLDFELSNIQRICYTFLDAVAEVVQVLARKVRDVGSNPTRISMESPEEYIKKQLNRLADHKADYSMFESDKELSAHIVKTVLSKKFRKWAVDDDLIAHLENAIKVNFEKKGPIKFVMPFGGYKLWRLGESPEADWAELFSMMFYALWLKPIADVYEPGVWFDFSSDDVVLERLDNISKGDTKAYKKTFEEVITFLEAYIPKNLKFTFTPVGSRYSSGEFDAELDSIMTQYLEEHDKKLPESSSEEKKMMDLNARRTEENLADPDWYGKNKLMHNSYMSVSKRRPYSRTEDKILVFTKILPKGVAVGTTKTSTAKFWAGVGALKRRGDSYIETVLSPEQIKTATTTWVPVDFKGLPGKNFNKIRIAE